MNWSPSLAGAILIAVVLMLVQECRSTQAACEKKGGVLVTAFPKDLCMAPGAVLP